MEWRSIPLVYLLYLSGEIKEKLRKLESNNTIFDLIFGEEYSVPNQLKNS